MTKEKISKTFLSAVTVSCLALAVGCSQPPTQITINANSSADKTDTYTETNTETNTLRSETNLSATATSRNSTVVAPPSEVAPIVASAPTPAPKTLAATGTCTWNGVSEGCRSEWSGQIATVTWLSDNKVTRYDFASRTVFDTSNGKTYTAISSDYNSGCISTANGSTCIYR